MGPTRSQHSDAVAGLIVAGGGSRRFGDDKARHRIAGMPMIARVHSALAAVADPVVVSVGTTGASYADVLPSDIVHVRDRHADAGPLAGLDAGFRAVRSDWVLVAACDMPHVTPDGFCTLLRGRHEAVDAVVGCSDEGRLHPLFACYRRERTLDAVQACLSEEAYALFALLDRLAVRDVEVPSDVVHNVNRPQDLDAP
jgi:molybdopterin-guanine dinucleotide biosynthesis protein A